MSDALTQAAQIDFLKMVFDLLHKKTRSVIFETSGDTQVDLIHERNASNATRRKAEVMFELPANSLGIVVHPIDEDDHEDDE